MIDLTAGEVHPGLLRLWEAERRDVRAKVLTNPHFGFRVEAMGIDRFLKEKDSGQNMNIKIED